MLDRSSDSGAGRASVFDVSDRKNTMARVMVRRILDIEIFIVLLGEFTTTKLEGKNGTLFELVQQQVPSH